MATCPECDTEIEIDEYDVDKGDLLSCPECGSNLEVVSVSPIDLERAPEDHEELGEVAEPDAVADEDEDEEEDEGWEE